eukprot:scaffold99604_cov18-Tisochrysis_lutea.AAC.2
MLVGFGIQTASTHSTIYAHAADCSGMGKHACRKGGHSIRAPAPSRSFNKSSCRAPPVNTTPATTTPGK